MVVLQMVWAILVSLFLLVLAYGLTFAVFAGPPLLLGWVCWRLLRKKEGKGFGEGLLLALIALLMIGTPSLMAIFHEKHREVGDHMRAALIRCGEMLKNGEREVLAQELSAFVESPEMHLDLLPFTVAFRKAVGAEEPPPPERTLPDSVTRIALGCYGAVCLLLLGVWVLMFLRKAESKKRHVYLIVLFCLSCSGVFTVWVGDGVQTGYSITAIRHDVRVLAEAVARPEVPSELLPQLENPEPRAYSYIRLLPPRESEE